MRPVTADTCSTFVTSCSVTPTRVRFRNRAFLGVGHVGQRSARCNGARAPRPALPACTAGHHAPASTPRLRHPAITAAIVGPRTMDHLESQLPAADVEL